MGWLQSDNKAIIPVQLNLTATGTELGNISGMPHAYNLAISQAYCRYILGISQTYNMYIV